LALHVIASAQTDGGLAAFVDAEHAMDAAIKCGLVDKRGSWLSSNDEQLGQGQMAATNHLESNPAITAGLIEKVMKKAHGK
jgi:RecA/RadA recombinase